jgi:hypothetical protein
VTAIASDPETADGIIRGCSDGRVLLDDRSNCQPTPREADEAVTRLAASRAAFVKIKRDQVCISQRPRRTSAIESHARKAGGTAVASDGARIALAFGQNVELYWRGWRTPWSAGTFELRSQIDTRGNVFALRFEAEDAEIVAVSKWKQQLVVRRFPLTGQSIAAATSAPPYSARR